MGKVRQTVLEVAGREVVITNPDKVIFPQAGHTKRDLVKYYAAEAEAALRGIAARPLVLKRYVNGAEREPFFRHGLAHERQRIGPSAEGPYRVREEKRFHVDDPIPESLDGARTSVVDLVQIRHDHLPWSARMDGAPVVEDLDAGVGHTDRIRVVAMFLIRLASEPRPEELDAIGRPRADEPLRNRALARSFKTLAGRSGFFQTHRSHPRAGPGPRDRGG